ncbi:hypothetical protein Aglo01_57710 [Actinokineospora globicatena]|nr:hypothetical protein Aglo01_57710 [Actinokineospora globicatena]GLW88012.1 hypothetical protein Aglo02_56510 [Actinokineospora globicatena]
MHRLQSEVLSVEGDGRVEIRHGDPDVVDGYDKGSDCIAHDGRIRPLYWRVMTACAAAHTDAWQTARPRVWSTLTPVRIA